MTRSGQLILAHRGLLLASFFGILLPLCVFVWLAAAVSNQRDLVWDAAILKLLHHSATSWCDRLMAFVARSGRIDVVVVFTVLGVLVLKHGRRLRDALFLTIAIVSIVVVNLLVRTGELSSLSARILWTPCSLVAYYPFPLSDSDNGTRYD